ncbi:Insulin-like growth factor-binding protein 7 [Microtus ochrogaster]|uniref:Insulin-like growth factor-binding protein 7 n=1 Tax=Microtus ochrogaster TaxID=79684 RepID=A0A8J6KQH4_MICOH|nr:Insulin-like growth factor-binding protein 7 [Microtus ochrogaster]
MDEPVVGKALWWTFPRAWQRCGSLALFWSGLGPSIVTPPKDIWNVTGAKVYLSCEVIGIPTPVLIWNKVKRDHSGVQRTELLPGDRENLAIQTRGGPEKHEVTGWVLVSPLSKGDAGEYECQAANSQGQASASAIITVVDALLEIPVKKGIIKEQCVWSDPFQPGSDTAESRSPVDTSAREHPPPSRG